MVFPLLLYQRLKLGWPGGGEPRLILVYVHTSPGPKFKSVVKRMEVVVEEYVVESWQREEHLYVGGQDHQHKESVSDEEEKNVAAYYDVTETEDNLTNEKETSNPNSLECPHCSKKFEFRNSLSNHIKSHSDFKQFQCQDCGRRFKKEGDYQRHRNLCGTAHKYICEICQKTFMNMNSLTNHARVHDDEKPFKCTNCSTAFKKQGDMKNHEVRIDSFP